MLKIDAQGIARAFSYLAGMIKLLELGRTGLFESRSQSIRLGVNEYATAVHYVELLSEVAERLGLEAASASAKRAHEILYDRFSPEYGYQLDDISLIINQLNPVLASFADELGNRSVFAMSNLEAEYYDAPQGPFADAIDSAFPEARPEIEEAGKCLATGRATASVFHLMRAMEFAVQGLSAKLGIANCEKEWGKLLSEITQIIESMPKGNNRDEWSEARTLLYHVKQAWRNSTMHPKRNYSIEEANEVFVAVRSFIKLLSKLVQRRPRL